MTLTEAKTLLERRRIPYQTAQYEDEAAYWRHLIPFPRTDHARKGKVIALVIPSVNDFKDIELQFNRRRGVYVFEELYFGGYSFELCYEEPDLLETSLLDFIGQIADGKLAIIEAHDRKRKRCISDSCYDMTDSDSVFGAPGFRDAVEKIEGPKSFWQKLTGRKIQYDIYDWNTYRQIVK